MKRIEKTIFYIKGKEIIMLNNLLPTEVILVQYGLAYQHAIDETEVQVIYASFNECKVLDVLVSVFVRFCNKYTWN